MGRPAAASHSPDRSSQASRSASSGALAARGVRGVREKRRMFTGWIFPDVVGRRSGRASVG
jgi:hypothetical protein